MARVTILGVVFVLQACTSAPLNPDLLTVQSRKTEFRKIQSVVSASLRKKAKIVDDQRANRFVNSVLHRMLSKYRVQLVERSDWHVYSDPVGIIYLPTKLLREIEYENELAAVLALQIARIEGQQLVEGFATKSDLLEYAKKVKTQPVSELFQFDGDQNSHAAESAVTTLYKGGYDPRGQISVLKKFLSVGVLTLWEPHEIEKVIRKTRSAVSFFAPLSNPIVKTKEFLAVQKRLRKQL